MTESSAHYLPPPTRCESLSAIVERFDGTMRGEQDVGTPAINGCRLVSAEINALLTAVEYDHAPTEAVGFLPEGRVFGAGVVLAPDGRSIARDVSLDFGRGKETHWLLNDKKIRPPQLLTGRTAVIASTLGEGYCHWLLDELPRLLLLEKSDAATGLLARADEVYSRAALALYGWRGAITEPARRGHWQAEELIVPGLSGWTGRATSSQLDRIIRFVEPLHRKPVVAGERIYISRASARRRRVTNEVGVVALLAGEGFVAVRLEELSWQEQINVFRHAKIIVAPHGAGLANLVFCQRGTRVIELFNRAYLNGCFWQIAALRDLDYQPLVPAGDEPLGCDPRSNRLDFSLDLAQLQAALA